MFPSTLVSINILVISFASSTFAANDWKTPCITGSCSYESGDGVKSTYSTLQLSGTSEGISDITPAAGWAISGCDPNSAEAQSITLTCDPKGSNADKCSHVSSGEPVDKIIRLPESCGKGPYARIASWDTPKTKRAGDPVKHICNFDYDFAKIPSTANPVSFTVYGTSKQGALDHLNTLAQRDLGDESRAYPRRGLAPRGFFDSLADGVKSAVSDVGDVAKTAASTVADAAKTGATAVADTAKAATSAAAAVTTFDESKTAQKLAPVNIDKTLALFHATLSCGASTGSIDVSVHTKFTADITTGFAVKGSVVPPKLDEFALYAGMNGKLDAAMTVLGTADGFFDSTKIPIFPSLGLPGLSIPGILSVGPEVSINGQVTGTLNANVNVTAGVSKSFNNVQLAFPPNKGKSSAAVVDNKSPFGMDLGASGDAVGNVALHIIPRLDFGIDAIKGLFKATIFLELDASANMQGTVSASVAAKKVVAPAPKPVAKKPVAAVPAAAPAVKAAPKAAATPAAAKAAPKAAAVAPAKVAAPKAAAAPVAKAAAAKPKRNEDEGSDDEDTEDEDEEEEIIERRAVKVTNAQINGCVTLDLGVDIRAGAQGTISPFFSDSTSVNLFSKTAQVLNKCFGATKARRSSRGMSSRRGLAFEKRALTCAKTAGLNTITNIIKQALV